MLQRSIVFLLLVVGIICLGYGTVSYHPPGTPGGTSWLVAILVGGILTQASVIHLAGIAYSEVGFSLRKNWAGRLLGSISRDEKNPDAELAHCALYSSGLVASLFGLMVLIVVSGGVAGVDTIVTNWGLTSTHVTPVDWGDVRAVLGYVLLGIAGLGLTSVAIVQGAKLLSRRTGWDVELTAATISAIAIGGLFVFLFMSTSRIDIGVLEAMRMTIVFFASIIGGLVALLISFALIASPLWAHIAIKKFFPNLYRRICPIVSNPHRAQNDSVAS